MELLVKDRLYIPAILPKDGNFSEFNLKKKIIGKIEISEKERETIGLKENKETNRIEWDTEKDQALNVEFTAEEIAFLKQSCEKITDQNLPDDMWGTVEKIYNVLTSDM